MSSRRRVDRGAIAGVDICLCVFVFNSAVASDISQNPGESNLERKLKL
jgi:hypothetical protein